jgi:hypothetical protein
MTSTASPSKELDARVKLLMTSNPIPFEPRYSRKVPHSPGLYAIFRKDTGECLHAGQAKDLWNRLFVQHYKGGGKGAGSDLIQKVQTHGCARDRASSQDWIRVHCLIQWLEEPDREIRHWAEHRLLSRLRPIWSGP